MSIERNAVYLRHVYAEREEFWACDRQSGEDNDRELIGLPALRLHGEESGPASAGPFFGGHGWPTCRKCRSIFRLHMDGRHAANAGAYFGCTRMAGMRRSLPLRHLVELIDLARALAGDLEEPLRVLDDLLLRIRLQQRITADDLLGLGKRAVGNRGSLGAGALVHAEALGAEAEALGLE